MLWEDLKFAWLVVKFCLFKKLCLSSVRNLKISSVSSCEVLFNHFVASSFDLLMWFVFLLLIVGVFSVVAMLFSSFSVCSSHLFISEGVGVSKLLENSPSEEYIDSTWVSIRSGWVLYSFFLSFLVCLDVLRYHGGLMLLKKVWFQSMICYCVSFLDSLYVCLCIFEYDTSWLSLSPFHWMVDSLAKFLSYKRMWYSY